MLQNSLPINSRKDVKEIYLLSVQHRVQKTGKSRSLKKFGYTQDNALLFRPKLLSTSRPLVTALALTLEYTVPLV